MFGVLRSEQGLRSGHQYFTVTELNKKMSKPYKLQIDKNQEQYLGDADIENFKELLKKKAKGELKFYSQAEFSDKMVQKGYKW